MWEALEREAKNRRSKDDRNQIWLLGNFCLPPATLRRHYENVHNFFKCFSLQLVDMWTLEIEADYIIFSFREYTTTITDLKSSFSHATYELENIKLLIVNSFVILLQIIYAAVWFRRIKVKLLSSVDLFK